MWSDAFFCSFLFFPSVFPGFLHDLFSLPSFLAPSFLPSPFSIFSLVMVEMQHRMTRMLWGLATSSRRQAIRHCPPLWSPSPRQASRGARLPSRLLCTRGYQGESLPLTARMHWSLHSTSLHCLYSNNRLPCSTSSLISKPCLDCFQGKPSTRGLWQRQGKMVRGGAGCGTGKNWSRCKEEQDFGYCYLNLSTFSSNPPHLISTHATHVRRTLASRAWWETFLSFYYCKSDRFQISPAASPEILLHTVWRT